MHPSIVPDLKKAGFEVEYQPDISREMLKESIHQYDGIIIRSKTDLDREMLDLATNL